jgi:hypothetical protein
MHYQVPQFIEIEDKIFGPFTLKQFIYLAGGGGVCLICFTLLPIFFAILIALPFVVLAFALAFYRVNDRPFIVVLEHAFKFFISSKLYLWKQRTPEVPNAPTSPQNTNTVVTGNAAIPQMTTSKLRDLAWSLNIKDHLEGEIETKPNSSFAL